MSTIGLYFSMSQEDANAMRKRLNDRAKEFGYEATRGPTTGEGNLSEMLMAIDGGEVVMVLLPDEQRRWIIDWLFEEAALLRATADDFRVVGIAKACKVIAEALEAMSKKTIPGEIKTTSTNSFAFTEHQWFELCKLFDNKCARCGKNVPLFIDHIVGASIELPDVLDVRYAAAYIQEQYGYPVKTRTVRKWLKLGHLKGEFAKHPVFCFWETTKAAIDEAWLAGRIPGKPGPKPSKKCCRELERA